MSGFLLVSCCGQHIPMMWRIKTTRGAGTDSGHTDLSLSAAGGTFFYAADGIVRSFTDCSEYASDCDEKSKSIILVSYSAEKETKK